MKKKIVKQTLLSLILCFTIHIGYSQSIDCNHYLRDQIIIETYTGQVEGIKGTEAFTQLGGIAIDSIIDPNYYSIYLVQFQLPNAYFNTIIDVHEFYECGEGLLPTSNGILKYKTKSSDFNYPQSPNSPIPPGIANYNLQNYSPYSGCTEPYPGIPPIPQNCNNTKVAIIDSGHQPGSPFDNRILIDLGYDFVDDDPYPIGQHPHGTMITSIVAAETNNNSNDISFIPVRVLDENGEGTLWQFFEGLDYGIDNAEISLVCLETLLCETDTCTRVYESILYKAEIEGKLVVGAAGNSSVLIDEPYYYSVPGSGQGDNLIVVGGSDCFEEPMFYSNFGKVNVDLYAPSDNILVYPSAYVHGTSFAAPQIASVAAMKSLSSPFFYGSEIKSFILNNVIDRGWQNQSVTGGTFDYTSNFGTCSLMGMANGNNEEWISDSDHNSLSMKCHFNKNNLSLSVISPENQDAQLSIMHLSGAIVTNQILLLQKGNNEFQFNSNQFPPAIYALVLKTANGEVLFSKILKYM